MKPVPKVLEMRVVDWFKLSSPCTAHALHTTGAERAGGGGGGGGGQINQPSALALGLRDGSVCMWDVSSPARAMLSVLGQHSYRRGCAVSALQFWSPKGQGLGLGPGLGGNNTRGGGGGGGGVTTNRRATATTNTIINNNMNTSTGPSPFSLRLISGADDGTICFFDVMPTPTISVSGIGGSGGGGGGGIGRTTTMIMKMTDTYKQSPPPLPPVTARGPGLGPGLGGLGRGDGLRDYRNDFVGVGVGEGEASRVVRIELLHYHVGIALVVLQVKIFISDRNTTD